MLAKTTYTGRLNFLQVQVTSLLFYERPTLLLVFTTEINLKRIFDLQLAMIEAAARVAFQVPSHHDATIASSCVCELLCYISIYLVHSCFNYMLVLF